MVANRIGQPLPRSHTAALLRALTPMVREVRSSLASVTTPADAVALGRALRARWSDARLLQIVRAAGQGAEEVAARPWGPILRRLPPPRRGRVEAMDQDGAALVDRWTREAFALIKSVRSEVAEGLRRDVVRALEAGTPLEAVQRRWLRQGIPVEFGTMEGRIKVIAQNQIARLNVAVQRERARQVGVSEFVWHHSGKTNFRPHHKARDGKTYPYDGSRTDGELPGEPPNCGCWAESVIPDEVAAELGLGSIFAR